MNTAQIPNSRPAFDATMLQPFKPHGFELRPKQVPAPFVGGPAVPWDTTLIDGLQDAPKAHATSIVIMVRAAFERLKSGSGEPKDFDRVGAAINVGLVRAEAIDPLAEQTMLAGVAAMEDCDRIYQRHGRYGFTGPGLTAVADAIALYEGIVRLSKPVMMERAVEEVARRMLAEGQAV